LIYTLPIMGLVSCCRGELERCQWEERQRRNNPDRYGIVPSRPQRLLVDHLLIVV